MAFAAADGGYKSLQGKLYTPTGTTSSLPRPAAPTVTQTTYGVPGASLPPLPLPTGFAGYTPAGWQAPAGSPSPAPVAGFSPSMESQYQQPAAPEFQLPDFNTLLQSQLEKLGFGQLDSNLKKAQEQLLIRYGDPSLASLAGFGADPQAAAFAQQNYLSGNADLARLDKASKEAKQKIINALAGRGLLFSGETGFDLGQQDQAYGNQRYDLTSKYLDQLNQLLQNTLAQKSNMRQNLVNSLLGFYSQYAQQPQALAGVFG